MTKAETEIKAAIRARDGSRCTDCGITDEQHQKLYGHSLEVHRIVPGSEYSLEPGVCTTLCKPCHGPKPRQPHGTNRRRVVVTIKREIRDALRLAASQYRVSMGELLGAMIDGRIGPGLTDQLVIVRNRKS